ncbi:Jag N-terminal domain-containing protein [Sulfurimonas marina]|uniref:Protein jag n=1 Tax=Sulfurimonas marina TaxID=2590551 RepID=A0A7M1ATA2_9BACT|nr:Jag N-terminal domain-containing protein [Sulfurimonas marina]QOP40645.1 protein jag [Sulfurimonas marina]
MIKIESISLEQAYKEAAESLNCSVTELVVEVVQAPSSGFLGFFKKKAVIVATVKNISEAPKKKKQEVKKEKTVTPTVLNDTILPESFVSDQEEDLDEDLGSGLDYTADYDDAYDEVDYEDEPVHTNISEIVAEVKHDINQLFKTICFDIEEIEVSAYDDTTLLIEFKGEDAALLIGKEGYRYKALSYMLFNWINAKYDLQLRLEIAEFLQNQEEAVAKYLEGVYEIVERDGRAQTKILDGVLVQIALKELRNRYPDKYVVIRSTKEGLKYIIINDYHV